MLDWDDLRVFLAVARGGSLSAAARTLGITQPTVGRRIRAFERQLGARLFVATPSGQGLSTTGKLLLNDAEQMAACATSAERIASGRDLGLRGRVRITASEWVVGSVLVPLLGPLITAHENLELDLVADARHLSLAGREADLGIRPSPFDQADIVQRQVGVVAFGLYASDAYLGRHGAPDFGMQGEGQALIAMSESLNKIPDVDWLPALVGRATVKVRVNGREPMVGLAAAGYGMACLPCYLGDRAPACACSRPRGGVQSGHCGWDTTGIREPFPVLRHVPRL